MEKKILIVGGTWNENGGKPSKLINKMFNEISKRFSAANISFINGGNYEQLKEIITQTNRFDYVFWFANVEDNELEKVRDVKHYAPKCMLITSKRNDNNKYSYEDIFQRMLAIKANLCFEFSKVEDKLFNIRVLDPLGCIYYDGTDIKEAVERCLDRLAFISNVTRKPSVHNQTELNICFNEADYKFLDIVKESAAAFHRLMYLPENVDRFVGNASIRFKKPTRCMNGFPAIRKGNLILMSRRNVDKTGIGEKDFVPCFLNNDENTEYFGSFKPSVDSPVQLRIFKKFPNIDYILHGHCYIKDAPITSKAVPCGAIEEVNEILSMTSDVNYDFYAFNLKGHGCVIFANADTLDKMRSVEFKARSFPEFME